MSLYPRCGSAFVTGYLAAEYLAADLAKGIEAPAAAAAEERTTNGKYYAGTYSVAKNTGFSTVEVTMTFSEDAITECKITSTGENDLLTAENRDGWAAQIVESQGESVDAITGVTLSTNAVKEAVAEILAQATA